MPSLFFFFCVKWDFFLPLVLKIFSVITGLMQLCHDMSWYRFLLTEVYWVSWIYSFRLLSELENTGQYFFKYLQLPYPFSPIFLGLQLHMLECLVFSHCHIAPFFKKIPFSLWISFWIVSTAMSSRLLFFFFFLPLCLFCH